MTVRELIKALLEDHIDMDIFDVQLELTINDDEVLAELTHVEVLGGVVTLRGSM